MLKLLIVVAFMANLVLVVSSTGSYTQETQEYEDEASSSSLNDSSSDTFESSKTIDDGNTKIVNEYSSSGYTDNNSANSNNSSKRTYEKIDDNGNFRSINSSSSSNKADSSASGKTTKSSSSIYIKNNNSKTCNNTEPEPKQCGAHETWEICPFDICRPKDCSEVGFPIACPGVTVDGKCPVKAACICEEGYARNKNGVCVLYKECPSCGGDSNAESGCGMNCGRLCSNYNKGPAICNKMCRFNSCDCKKNYVYDEVALKCVLPKDCTPVCGPNEVSDGCANGGCYTARTCKDLDTNNGTFVCYDVSECIPGCICKPGYVKNNKGVCIPEYKCPNSKCKNPNETFLQCVSNCQVETCDQVGYGTLCPIGENPPCTAKCICIDGYVRNDKGVCIPKTDCPTCGGDPNAGPGCGINCGKQCSDYNKGPVACIDLCKDNACDCKKGYVYDANINRCVKPEECTPICNEDEVFDGCANGGCYSARTCIDLDRNGTFICVDVRPCIPGCLCKEGLLRNKKGICIPENTCPNSKCKKANETYNTCPSGLCSPKSCAELGFPVPCPIVGPDGQCSGGPGCICRSGFLKDKNGVCVPQIECPSCGGDKNATSGCGGNCGRRCSDYGKKPGVCPLSCRLNGCDCKEGYYYDDKTKKCVLPSDCSTPVCGINEEPNSCINGGCYSGRTCDDLDRLNGSTICVDPIECKPGCLCKPGFLRNSKGVCVQEYECPNSKCKKPYETFRQCVSNCDVKKCDQLGIGAICTPTSKPAPCEAKCTCIEGYLRDKDGNCIPQDQCPLCGGDPNAQSGCGKNCGRLCSNYNTGPVLCTLECIINSCDCKKDYVYDSNLKKCVLPQECTPVCGQNEEYSSCVNGECHNATSCSNLNAPYVCVRPKECFGGCKCKPGYVKNNNGVCILIKECPDNEQCKGKKLYYDYCPPTCPQETCKSLETPVVCLPQPQVCRPRCRCAEGYYKNDENICIPKKQCPRKCPKNEVFNGCINGNCYGARKCSEIGAPIKCVKLSEDACIGGCLCRDDYLRNSSGICVPPQECPNYCKKNETYDLCPKTCPPRTCGIDDRAVLCLAGPKIGDPKCPRPACRCKDGYSRNDKGECILYEDCPKCTKPNEVYKVCPATCPPRKCGVDVRGIRCAAPPEIGSDKCRPGCVCDDGFVTDYKGNCIKREHCPPKPICNKTNEIYDECPAKCPPRYCGIDDRLVDCTPEIPNGDPNCPPPACICKKGSYWDNKGNCVKWADCPKCTKPNQVYKPCPVTCPPQQCGVDVSTTECAAPLEVGNPNCQPGCVCDDGFVSDKNGNCIKREQCPKCTKQDEEYVECPNPCDPNTCESINKKYNCPLQPVDGKRKCVGQCRCKPNFFRNKLGDCISKENCLKCSGPNEYYSCGGACDNVCATLSDQSQDNCPIINIVCNKMCYCDRNYARNASGICVPFKDCPTPKCCDNEEYSSCVQGVCRAQKCSQKGQSVPCPDIMEGSCIKGCICKENFLRGDDGKCIPEDKCTPTCTGNANWNTCPPQKCDAENCPRSRTDPQACKSTKNCGKPRCTCGFNQKRDRETGNCIPIAKCPPFKCDGPNEKYQSCPRRCPGETCKDYLNNATCPKYNKLVVPCEPQCRCLENFYRNSEGICVKACDCKKDVAVVQPTTPAPGGNPGDIEKGQQQLSEGINEFAFSCLRQMVAAKPGENIIASPLSIQVALAQLGVGAADEGDSLKEILAALNLSSKDQILQIFKVFLENFKGGDGVTFEMVVKEYVNKEFQLNPTYESNTRDAFNATVESIDCSKPEEAANQINTFVAENTNNRIKNLIPTDLINELVRVILVNAIYFQGSWKKEFNKNNTLDRDFHIDTTTTVQVQTMYIENQLNYADSADIDAQVADIEFNNTNFKLRIVVPHQVDGLSNTLAKLNAATMKKVSDSMSVQKCKLWMPKFEINSSFDLIDILKALNVTAIFDAKKAQLVNIVKTLEDLFVSAFIQKAYIKADEKGAEAAAATAVVVVTDSVVTEPDEFEIKANHPFMFFIIKDESITFSGSYRK